MKKRRWFKKVCSFVLLAAMLLGNVPSEVFALENTKEPLMFEDFENEGSVIKGTTEATVSLEDGSATGNGSKVAKLAITNSGEPKIDTRSLVVTKTNAVDVSDYKYLSFWIKDNGTNSARVSLIDATGKSVDGGWTGNVAAGKWSQLSLELTNFTGVDFTKIVGIYIGEWNKGTYLIDDIQFSDVLAKDLVLAASKPSGTYNDDFELTLSAAAGQQIYYTVDGTTPTTASTLYNGAIEVKQSTTVKAIVVDHKNVSGVYEYVYVIDHVDNNNYTPVVAQTFEQESNFTAGSDATGTIVTDQKHSGQKSLAYTKAKSAGAEVGKGDIKVDFNHALNIGGLKYLVFYIKDTQGSNTLQASLIDQDGNESSFAWQSPSTSKNKWVQYYVKVSNFSGIDKTKVTGLRIGQWNAGTYYLDDVYFDNYLYTGVPELTPRAPVSNVASGYIFKDKMTVSLKNDGLAPMYYTTDGSTPTNASTPYQGSLTIDKTTTLKVVSYDNGTYSEVTTLTYTLDNNVISDVKADKVAGKYAKAIKVALSSEGNNDIYYTTDGTAPTKQSTKYTTAINVAKTTTIKAIAYNGDQAGNVSIFTYTYPTTPTKVTASIAETKFTSNKTIELLSDLDATIYYTTDGSTPDESSTLYTQPLTISKSMTVKAIAYRDGKASEVSTINYVIAPVAVVADKPAGTYDNDVVVEFRVPKNDQIEIYYTTDGSEPTAASNHYTQPIRVTQNTTFKVGATYMGSLDIGIVTTHEYIINPIEKVVAPVITPSAGTYGQRQLVSMSTVSAGGKVYYTTDGSNPTKDSQEFKDAFYATKDMVVKAITVKDNEVSDVTTNKIVITNKKSAFLKTDGKVIRDNYGAGNVVQLKGTNIGGWLVMEEWQCPTTAPDQKTMLKTLTERFGEEKAWELVNTYQDNWITSEDIKTLKAEGVNCLRLPVTYFEMCNEDGSLKETAFDRLDWFVEEAAKEGIYTLIDMHGAFGSQNGKDHSGDIAKPDVGDFFGNEANIQKTIALWKAIATRYNGNEWVAGYDLLNEPGGALGTEQFEVYDRLYDAIRAIDQDHIIQIQAIWEPTHLPNPELYGWENVVYQYHFYGWTDINNLAYQKAFIDSKVKYVNEYTNYNVPLFVGEFTFFTNTDSWEYGLGVFDEQGWSYTSWTYKVAGAGSSWGMYTMPKNDATNVNIYNDSYDTIKAKWSKFDFTRNDSIANVLSKHFKVDGVTTDKVAPVIEANDVKVVVKSATDVKALIDLFVKDNLDGVINDATISGDYDLSKAGVYQITVTATDKAGNVATKDVTITVVNAAQLVVDNDQINIGDKFDPMAGVVVKDVDGTDITAKVTVVENNVDVTKAGEYKVIYEVTDALGNLVRFERVVTVKAAGVDVKPGETVKPGEIVKPEGTVKPNDSATAVKTGDKANLGNDLMILGLAMLVGLGYLRKRKEI